MRHYTLIFIISFFFFVACNNKRSSNLGKSKSEFAINPQIILNAPGDTSEIDFEHGGYLFKMYYSKNIPQYIVVKNKTLVNKLKMNHYASENNGLYMTLSDSASVNALGFKYLNGHNGVDIIMNPSDNRIKFLKDWKEYTNDGNKYDFSEVEKGKLKVYKYKDGEVIDSFLMKRQDK